MSRCTHLEKKMQVEDKGEMSFALDTRIQRDTKAGILKISQRDYIENLMKTCKVEGTKDTPHLSESLLRRMSRPPRKTKRKPKN